MTNALRKPTRLRLHLGAHRTATTALQETMRQAEGLLATNSVMFLTRWGFGNRENERLRRVSRQITKAAQRRGLMAWLKVRTARKAMNTLLAQSQANTLILSDENLLGDPFSHKSGAAIYPDCERNLSITARTLQLQPERVHITIRDYSTFLVSVYAMQALYRPGAPSFESIKDTLLCLDHRWTSVLRSARATFPDTVITFSTYEAKPVQSVLTALVTPDLAVSQFSIPPRGVNRAPSKEAIEIALNSGQRSPAETDELIQKFVNGTPFDPLSASEKDRLSAIYSEELSQLRAEFREVYTTDIADA